MLLSCVCIYLRSASEESHKETQEHSAHFTCGVHGRGRSFNLQSKIPSGELLLRKIVLLKSHLSPLTDISKFAEMKKQNITI